MSNPGPLEHREARTCTHGGDLLRPGPAAEFRTGRSLRQLLQVLLQRLAVLLQQEAPEDPRFRQRLHRSHRLPPHETLILELRSLTVLLGCSQSVSPGLDVNGWLRAPRQRVCATLDTSLASLELGSQRQASQLGGCGQHGSQDRLAGQPPVAGLFHPTWLPVQVSGLRVTQRGRDEALLQIGVDSCSEQPAVARMQTTGQVHRAATGPPCCGSLTAQWLVVGLKLPGGRTPNSPVPSGRSHKAARSTCNRSSGRALVAMTHGPHPGSTATAGQGTRACSHPHPYTPPFSSQAELSSADQQTTSLLESSVAGGGRGGWAGERAGPEPYTCLKLQDLGDGTGQCPAVTPGRAWPPQQMFPAMESSWPRLRVGEGRGGGARGTAVMLKSKIEDAKQPGTSWRHTGPSLIHPSTDLPRAAAGAWKLNSSHFRGAGGEKLRSAVSRSV